MGCQCSERANGLRRTTSAAVRGDLRGAGKELAAVARSLGQDIRTGALQREAAARLAALRSKRR